MRLDVARASEVVYEANLMQSCLIQKWPTADSTGQARQSLGR